MDYWVKGNFSGFLGNVCKCSSVNKTSKFWEKKGDEGFLDHVQSLFMFVNFLFNQDSQSQICLPSRRQDCSVTFCLLNIRPRPKRRVLQANCTLDLCLPSRRQDCSSVTVSVTFPSPEYFISSIDHSERGASTNIFEICCNGVKVHHLPTPWLLFSFARCLRKSSNPTEKVSPTYLKSVVMGSRSTPWMLFSFDRCLKSLWSSPTKKVPSPTSACWY